MADPSLVPSPVNDPGFRSINPGVRVAAVSVAGLVVAGGLWAFARPGAPANLPPPALHSAAPAVEPDSLDSVIADHPRLQSPIVRPTPTPRPIEVRHAAAVEQAPVQAALPPAPPPAEVAIVPRVETAAEIASSKMTIDAPPAPEAPAAQGTTAESASPPAHPSSGLHSSFFADQGSGGVGYESENAPCIVRATSAIAARLVTRVDSELPGGVVKAQVIRPVNCADGDEAIPAGAVLQGTYDSGTVAGESRLLGVFSRIIFPPSSGHPNGRAYAIATQSATDALGGTGLSGRVNTHSGRALGQALVYTVLGAAGSALGNVGNHGTTIGVGGGSSIAGQFGGATSQKPTIYANPGDPVDVVLSRDLPMEPLPHAQVPHAAAPPSGTGTMTRVTAPVRAAAPVGAAAPVHTATPVAPPVARAASSVRAGKTYWGQIPAQASFSSYANWVGCSPPMAEVYTDRGASWPDNFDVIPALAKVDRSGVPIMLSLSMIPQSYSSGDAGMVDIAKGVGDAAIKTAASQILSGDVPAPDGNIYIRIFWETPDMNTGIWSGASPDNWKAAYAHVASIFHAASPRFKMVWDIAPWEQVNPADYYPGDSFVDVFGQDQYFGTAAGEGTVAAAWSYALRGRNNNGLAWLASFAAAHNKPTSIDEWGFDSDNAGPLIVDLANWAEANNLAFAMLFDANWNYLNFVDAGRYPTSGSVYKGVACG